MATPEVMWRSQLPPEAVGYLKQLEDDCEELKNERKLRQLQVTFWCSITSFHKSYLHLGLSCFFFSLLPTLLFHFRQIENLEIVREKLTKENDELKNDRNVLERQVFIYFRGDRNEDLIYE